MRRYFRATMLVALVVIVAIPAVGAETMRPDPDRLAAEVISALDLQRDLVRDRSQDDNSHFRPDLPDEVLWLAALLSLALLVYAFRDMIPVWRTGGSEDWLDTGGTGGASAEAAKLKIAQADELARAGLFADAMHALLLQSLAEIRSRLDARIADSLTSREILRRVRLTAQGAAAFREIILSVEWTYFGENPADASDYGRCRQHFEALGRSLAAEAT